MKKKESQRIYLSIIYGVQLILFLVIGCKGKNDEELKDNIQHDPMKGTYGYDLAFMKENSKNFLELISADSSARVLLSPQWQGRVMTSTAMGDTGTSFGWLNYDLLKSGEKRKQFNPIGGEERFWIGPEGGQYSVYFQKGDSFTIDQWQVPAIIDTIPFEVVQSAPSNATFKTKAKLTNYSGTQFDFDIERRIDLASKEQLEQQLGISIPNPIHFVGYKTKNTLINTGNEDWNKKDGLLSIWLLGMFSPTPQTFVIIPFRPVAHARSMITDNYFGTVPPERLRVSDSVLYFTCDGKLRSKIGISPAIAKPIAGSFDFANNVLTLVIPEVQSGAAYVNSKWELQKDPYKGDVINSYNDGPLADGTQLGPFYEIESSSPALELAKGKTGTYVQTTCHLQGAYENLKTIAKQILGVDLDTLKP